MSQTLSARLLLASVAVLLLLCAVDSRGFSYIDEPLWSLQNASSIFKAVTATVFRVAVFCAVLLTIVVACASYLKGLYLNRFEVVLWSFLMTALLIVLCAFVREGVHLNVLPIYVMLAIPIFLFGLILAWWFGRSAKVSSVVWKALSVFGIGLIASVMLIVLMHDSRPFGLPPVEVSSNDRVRLTTLIRQSSPRNKPRGQPIALRLSEDDINKLASWGLSFGESGRAFYVRISDSHARAALSMRMPYGNSINVLGEGSFAIYAGELSLDLQQLSIGSLVIPGWLASLMGEAVYEYLLQDPRFRPVLTQLIAVTLQKGEMVAHYGGMDLPDNVRDEVFGALGDRDVLAAAFSEHMHNLRRVKAELPQIPPEQRFSYLLETTFGIVQRRVRMESADALLESRLALVSLGLALGHPRLAEVITHLPPGFSDGLRLWSDVPLRGRSDWTRHFWVSAALVVLSNAGLSVEAGRLKEEIDAASEGGSGFSFADLGADKSGVAFAQWITRSEMSARRSVSRLAESSNVEDLVPPLDDFAEGLTLEELNLRYGGVEGEGYKEVETQIDSRIRQLYSTLR